MSDEVYEEYDEVDVCTWCEGFGLIEQPTGGFKECPECGGKGVM